MSGWRYSGIAAAIVALSGCTSLTDVAPTAAVGDRCAAFASALQGHWPDASTRVASAVFVPEGPAPKPDPQGFQYDSAVPLKAHCDVQAVMAERTGVDGESYAIKFHLRLPMAWNGRFLFQGGGGTNGDIGNALGALAGVGLVTPALAQGYAVVSQGPGMTMLSTAIQPRAVRWRSASTRKRGAIMPMPLWVP